MMLKKMSVSLLAAATLCGCQSASKQVIWSQDGEITSKDSGWTFTPSKNKGKMTYYPDEGYYLDRGGKLTGPRIPFPDGEFKYFQYTFESKSPVRCYWAMDFYDADGNRIKGDCYSSIFPSAKPVKNTCVLYGRIGTDSVEPFFQSTRPYSILNPQLEEITVAEAAQWCDDIYKTVPPLNYVPEKGRLKYLPKTMNALKTGKKWRMHILGHSLYNDTYNSIFPALIKRMYPKSSLEVTWCGKGGTGCEHYQDHVQEYVVDYHPDVVIVCGLARGHDIEQIASVVKQIKEKIGCEMILMTEPFGFDIRTHKEDDRTTPLPKQKVDADKYFKEWTRKVSKGKQEMKIGPIEFTKIQKDFAAKEKIAFLDAKNIWYQYLGESGKPWEWFNRDVAHANDRGKQIVGRMLERFLSEK